MQFEHRDDQIYIQTDTGMEAVIGAHVRRDIDEYAIITRPRCGRQFHYCNEWDVDHYRDILDKKA